MCRKWEVGSRKWEAGRGKWAARVLVLTSPFFLLTSPFFLLTSCGVYSFSGASLPEHLRTVAIPPAEVRAQGAVPSLDAALTDALVARFVDQTRLSLEPDETQADALLEVVLERYTITPVAVTGDEVASLNRVTISVAARYTDRVEDRERLARSFSDSQDYDPAEGAAGEAEAAARAIETIADDIFTAATSDW